MSLLNEFLILFFLKALTNSSTACSIVYLGLKFSNFLIHYHWKHFSAISPKISTILKFKGIRSCTCFWNSKNSVLAQCFGIACIASIVWIVCGYSIAFNGDGEYFGNLDKLFLFGFSWCFFGFTRFYVQCLILLKLILVNFFGFLVITRHHAMHVWRRLEENFLSASRSFLKPPGP